MWGIDRSLLPLLPGPMSQIERSETSSSTFGRQITQIYPGSVSWAQLVRWLLPPSKELPTFPQLLARNRNFGNINSSQSDDVRTCCKEQKIYPIKRPYIVENFTLKFNEIHFATKNATQRQSINQPSYRTQDEVNCRPKTAYSLVIHI